MSLYKLMFKVECQCVLSKGKLDERINYKNKTKTKYPDGWKDEKLS